MKDQYFADINDYRKYGMLRLLAAESGLSLGVCWMLTPPDARTDGRFTAFWSDPQRWRRYDPALFDALCRCASTGIARRVTLAREWGILPGAIYFEEIVPDDVAGRQGFFDRAWKALRGCDLIVLDPHNGLQVSSVPYGRRNSSKYVYWSEVETGFVRGHSLDVPALPTEAAAGIRRRPSPRAPRSN